MPITPEDLTGVINERIKKLSIRLGYGKGFTTNILTSVINFYDIKSQEKYSYKHVIGNQESYTYSEMFIDFIIAEMQKNPDTFIDSLRKKIKITPGT